MRDSSATKRGGALGVLDESEPPNGRMPECRPEDNDAEQLAAAETASTVMLMSAPTPRSAVARGAAGEDVDDSMPKSSACTARPSETASTAASCSAPSDAAAAVARALSETASEDSDARVADGAPSRAEADGVLSERGDHVNSPCEGATADELPDLTGSCAHSCAHACGAWSSKRAETAGQGVPGDDLLASTCWWEWEKRRAWAVVSGEVEASPRCTGATTPFAARGCAHAPRCWGRTHEGGSVADGDAREGLGDDVAIVRRAERGPDVRAGEVGERDDRRGRREPDEKARRAGKGPARARLTARIGQVS
jgi:hypothetical protein